MPRLPIVYLPGAGGRSSFWRPVADRLWRVGAPIVFGYPGFGDVPADETIGSVVDLYRALMSVLPPRFHLVAQSMGNVLALRMALEAPERVAGLVLSAVSGGIDVVALGGKEWRQDLRAEQPSKPTWFMDDRSDFTGQLGGIRAGTLILAADRDPLSPVRVGEFLRERVPGARLAVFAGSGHAVAEEEPDRVAEPIGAFLTHME